MLSQTVIENCRVQLIEKRSQILNQVRTTSSELLATTQEKSSGDEADQSVRLLDEQKLIDTKEWLLNLLFEVDRALARIESGTFGICEETLEPIEQNRLVALPWTRLSIEGAELREQINRRVGGRRS